MARYAAPLQPHFGTHTLFPSPATTAWGRKRTSPVSTQQNHNKVVICFAAALFKMSDRYRPIADIEIAPEADSPSLKQSLRKGNPTAEAACSGAGAGRCLLNC